jgi:hypothetical protein
MALTRRNFAASALAISAGLRHRLSGQSATLVRYLPSEDARPALAAFSSGTYSAELPAELKGRTLNEADWTAWIAQRDRSIRARLKAGDADSVANFALLGTSFTSLHLATETHGGADGIGAWR